MSPIPEGYNKKELPLHLLEGEAWLVAFDVSAKVLADFLAAARNISGIVTAAPVDQVSHQAGLAYAVFNPAMGLYGLPEKPASTAIFLGINVQNHRRLLIALLARYVRQLVFYDALTGWRRVPLWRLVFWVAKETLIAKLSTLIPRFGFYGQLFAKKHEASGSAKKHYQQFIAACPPPYQAKTNAIVLCNNGLAWGGAERQLVATLAGLRAAGFDDLHFACDDISSTEARRFFLAPVHALQVKIHEMSSHLLDPEADNLSLPTVSLDAVALLPQALQQQVILYARLFAEIRPAVVHAWQDSTNIIVALAALLAGVPRIVMAGRNMAPHRFAYHQPYMQAAYQALLANVPTKRLVFLNNSTAGRNDYAAWLDVPQTAIYVLLNGTDTCMWQRRSAPVMAQLRQELGVPESAPLVGSIFRFYEEKDPWLWFDVVTRLAAMRPDAHFIVFGDGPMRATIKAALDKKGLGARVHLPGDRQDAALLHSVMDILLLTSKLEGTPNVLIEAALIGNPAVATDVGGVADVIQHGVTGFLSASRSAAELADYCLRLINDKQQAQKMGHAAQTLARQKFAQRRMLAETLVLYGLDTAAAEVDSSVTASSRG